MAKYTKAAREAFNAERARHATYWTEHVEDSFRNAFSWTEHIKNNKYRRSPSPANIKKP
ncbi:hypothetical protein OSE17_09770 [Pantoea agglomerans]|uniref:hypothetical protein n=1 Tax=Enterobacter agglomerans TaxID=549 RepID=UPI00226F7992|nr:hypothetical protein [Pantoea agglomerans]WAB85459.1 hypothetical protein OSE17_09770 [Pantoea agglomerans]